MHDTLTVLQRDEVYGNPDWTLAIFFRDPLERLLSGYINKCVEPKWRDSQCMPTVRTRGRRTCRRCTASLKGDAVPLGKKSHTAWNHLTSDVLVLTRV